MNTIVNVWLPEKEDMEYPSSMIGNYWAHFSLCVLTMWANSIHWLGMSQHHLAIGSQNLGERQAAAQETKRPNYAIYKFEVRFIGPPMRADIEGRPFAVQCTPLEGVGTSITLCRNLYFCCSDNFLHFKGNIIQNSNQTKLNLSFSEIKA